MLSGQSFRIIKDINLFELFLAKFNAIFSYAFFPLKSWDTNR